jgi:hypothetical protein
MPDHNGIAKGKEFQEAKMSYQRGITRLYIVAAAIWVMWGLYRPVVKHRQQAVEFLKDADARMGDCYRMKGEAELAGHGVPDPNDRCGTQYRKEADIAYKMSNYSPLEIYRLDLGSVAAGCLLPPAGGAILLGSLFWVARGFIRTAATGG